MEWFRSSKQRNPARPAVVEDVTAPEPEPMKSTPARTPKAVFDKPALDKTALDKTGVNGAEDLLEVSPSGAPQKVGYTIHSSRDGRSDETQFTSPTLTVARARALFKSGSLVYITDAAGRHFAPSEFNDVLKFD